MHDVTFPAEKINFTLARLTGESGELAFSLFFFYCMYEHFCVYISIVPHCLFGKLYSDASPKLLNNPNKHVILILPTQCLIIDKSFARSFILRNLRWVGVDSECVPGRNTLLMGHQVIHWHPKTLLVCFWELGGNRRTRKNPTHTLGEHVKCHTDSSSGSIQGGGNTTECHTVSRQIQ